jgi:sulfonate transport system substrate-binding protein
MSLRSSLPVLLLVCFATCGQPAATEPETAASPAKAPQSAPLTLRVGYQKIGAPFLLKERSESLQAALSKHNAHAEWIEFQAGPPILEAMRGGAVDIGYTGETPPVFAQAGGVPFVYIAREVGAPSSEAILVPKDSKLTSVADLKGKKVALNRGSNVHYLLLRALESAKLSIQDITVTYLAPPDARAASHTTSCEQRAVSTARRPQRHHAATSCSVWCLLTRRSSARKRRRFRTHAPPACSRHQNASEPITSSIASPR